VGFPCFFLNQAQQLSQQVADGLSRANQNAQLLLGEVTDVVAAAIAAEVQQQCAGLLQQKEAAMQQQLADVQQAAEEQQKQQLRKLQEFKRHSETVPKLKAEHQQEMREQRRIAAELSQQLQQQQAECQELHSQQTALPQQLLQLTEQGQQHDKQMCERQQRIDALKQLARHKQSQYKQQLEHMELELAGKVLLQPHKTILVCHVLLTCTSGPMLLNGLCCWCCDGHRTSQRVCSAEARLL
jgi:hypothetical protein